ncbi:MAG: hypothetical protein R3F62_21075 [Planctomycetota bacterium]
MPATLPQKLVYSLRVDLDDDLYRVLEVRSDQTLEELHEGIAAAFERDDVDLPYRFFLPQPGAWGRSVLNDAAEYAEERVARHFGVHNAERTTLGDLGLRVRRRFFYVFDCGDELWHELRVVAKAPVAKGQRKRDYPRVVESHGEAPPQWSDDVELEEPSEAW